MASNNVTITSAAVSHAVGEYIEFLGSDEDFRNAEKYADKISRCLNASSTALIAFCDATKALGTLRREDMLYE